MNKKIRCVHSFPHYDFCFKSVSIELKRRNFDIFDCGTISTPAIVKESNDCVATLVNAGVASEFANLVPGGKSIHLMHGISVWKGNIFVDQVSKTNKSLLPGRAVYDQLIHFGASFGSKVLPADIVGFSKVDTLVNKLPARARIKENVKKKYGIKGSVVAYLPTWDKPEKIIEKLDNVKACKIPGLIVGIHKSNGYHGTVLSALKGFKAWNDTDKDDLLLSADLIIGDNSSILIESLVADVPIIHLCSLDKLTIRGIGTLGHIQLGLVASYSTLNQCISTVLRHGDITQGYRAYWKDRLMYKADGKSTERTVDRIVNLIG